MDKSNYILQKLDEKLTLINKYYGLTITANGRFEAMINAVINVDRRAKETLFTDEEWNEARKSINNEAKNV